MRLLLLFLTLLTSCSSYAANPLQKHAIILMQPESVVQSRVPSVDALASYISAVDRSANELLATQAEGQPTSGFIVLAIRGQRVRSWLDLTPALPEGLALQLKTALARVMPFRAKEGPVVFALSVGVWGGQATTASAPSLPEFNAATAAAGRPLEAGELVERIWND